ncbi:MAG: hypothetical protein ACRCZK_06960 [Oscillospiraceae bacterium]
MYYCLREFNILPFDALKLSYNEKAFLLGALKVKIDEWSDEI